MDDPFLKMIKQLHTDGMLEQDKETGKIKFSQKGSTMLTDALKEAQESAHIVKEVKTTDGTGGLLDATIHSMEKDGLIVVDKEKGEVEITEEGKKVLYPMVRMNADGAAMGIATKPDGSLAKCIACDKMATPADIEGSLNQLGLPDVICFRCVKEAVVEKVMAVVMSQGDRAVH